MPIISVEEKEKKLKPCVCGEEKAATLYTAAEVSPDYTDVRIGAAVLAVIQVGLPVLTFPGRTLSITICSILLLPLIVTLLAIYRILRNHTTKCSFRWAFVVIAGLGRYLSF